ncbi:hypothetical protein P1X14_03325 [Sphingomonas sp. AOB5]|uniref:hypothetical protein n=1 Tax=Sphingomonas sp. AOB5 TaxID=3034017 RepID=UPI0023F87A6B|nr:hypothetical protein [Sphingomonas sp. AOB5]MDF7774269.1 hypothetical protein [Sphingomonas sp. AOB5]
MQVKFTRTTDTKGMFGGKRVYCLNAILSVSDGERALLDRFDLWQASLWFLADDYDPDLRNQLNKTLRDLSSGVRFECEDFNQVFALERHVVDACSQALRTAEARASFNGTDRVYEVTSKDHTFVTAD